MSNSRLLLKTNLQTKYNNRTKDKEQGEQGEQGEKSVSSEQEIVMDEDGKQKYVLEEGKKTH